MNDFPRLTSNSVVPLEYPDGVVVLFRCTQAGPAGAQHWRCRAWSWRGV